MHGAPGLLPACNLQAAGMALGMARTAMQPVGLPPAMAPTAMQPLGGRRVVVFLDFFIDIFLEVQNEKYS